MAKVWETTILSFIILCQIKEKDLITFVELKSMPGLHCMKRMTSKLFSLATSLSFFTFSSSKNIEACLLVINCVMKNDINNSLQRRFIVEEVKIAPF